MKSPEKAYRLEFGNVPKDKMQRFDYLLKDIDYRKSSISVYDEIDRIKNIHWETLSFVIYLVPTPTPRPRTGKFGFYVVGAKDNKKRFKKFVVKENLSMIVSPTKFACRSYLPIPKSMNKAEKVLAEMGFIRPISKPDFDNLAKTYSDMLIGSLLYDDAMIIEGSSKKYYSVKPRIEIDISYMTDYDCKYNKKKLERIKNLD